MLLLNRIECGLHASPQSIERFSSIQRVVRIPHSFLKFRPTDEVAGQFAFKFTEAAFAQTGQGDKRCPAMRCCTSAAMIG